MWLQERSQDNWCILCSMPNPKEAHRKTEAIAYGIPGSWKSFWSCSPSAHLVLTAWPWHPWTTHQMGSDAVHQCHWSCKMCCWWVRKFLSESRCAPGIDTVTTAVHPSVRHHHEGLTIGDTLDLPVCQQHHAHCKYQRGTSRMSGSMACLPQPL